jgi:hypothetical protein
MSAVRVSIVDYADAHNAYIYHMFDAEKIGENDNPGGPLVVVLASLFWAIFDGAAPEKASPVAQNAAPVARKSAPVAPKVAPLAQSTWFDMNVVSAARDNVVSLEAAGKRCRFRSAQAKEILEFIIGYLQRVLTPSEQASVSYPATLAQAKHANANSLIFRLKVLFHYANVPDKPLLGVVDIITNSLRLRSDRLLNLDFGPHTAVCLPILFQTLSMKNRIRHLGFEKTDDALFDILVANWQHLSNIRHITLKQPPTRPFIELIIKSRGPSLRGLRLDGFPFTDERLGLFCDLIQQNAISSIGFRNMPSPDSIHMISAVRNFNTLRFFEIDSIPNLDLPRLFPSLTHLVTLSITNCGLSIGDIFSAMGDSDFHLLREFNLSGNLGVNISSGILLPPRLTKLHANDVEWDCESFLAFVAIVSNSIPEGNAKLSLSVARCRFGESRWVDFSEHLSQVSLPHVDALTWDGNLVSRDILEFFSKATSLSLLSISNSVTLENIPLLTEFFSTNRTITRLIIKGSLEERNGPIGDPSSVGDLQGLFTALKKSRIVKSLDMRFLPINDDTSDSLAQWAMKSNCLEFLAFDGTKISCFDVLVRFCDLCQIRETPLQLCFPEQDVKRLACEEKTPVLAIHQLKHRFKNLRKPRSARRPFTRTEEPFTAPFDVFSGSIDDVFPEYLPVELEPQPEPVVTSSSSLKSPKLALSTSSRVSSGRVPVPEAKGEEDSDRLLISEAPPEPKDSRFTSSRRRVSGGGSSRGSVNSDIETPVRSRAKRISGGSSRGSVNSDIDSPVKSRGKRVELDWSFPIRFAPEIDNTEVVGRLNTNYSIDALLAALRSTP